MQTLLNDVYVKQMLIPERELGNGSTFVQQKTERLSKTNT